MADKDWEMAVELRGKSFKRNLETYKLLTRLKPPKDAFDAEGHGKASALFFSFLVAPYINFCMKVGLVDFV